MRKAITERLRCQLAVRIREALIAATDRARRVPAATLTMVLVAAGSAAQPTAPEIENPYTDRVDIGMGTRLFRARCSTCHGLNAKGDEEGGGPDLTRGRFEHATSDAGLYRVIRNGIRGTAMRGLGDEPEQSIWQLVTYLRSLSPTSAEVDLPGSPAAGRELFANRDCGSCHRVSGRGGRLGPDLSTIGDRRSPTELEADLRDPSAEVDPRWWTLRITRADGSVVEGLRMGEDTFSLRIMDDDENLRSFSKPDLAGYERVKDSTMPSYAQSLADHEMDDLVAYLFSLRTER